MHENSNTILLIAGVLSLGVAIFQAVISFVPQWSAAFDAGDELVSNPPLLLATGLLMTLVVGIFGLYGLSGAGAIRPLPLMRLGLLGIGAIYTLRGIAFVPQPLVVLEILPSPQAVPPVHPLVSCVALIVGVFYLAGVTKGWIRTCISYLKYLSCWRPLDAESIVSTIFFTAVTSLCGLVDHVMGDAREEWHDYV